MISKSFKKLKQRLIKNGIYNLLYPDKTELKGKNQKCTRFSIMFSVQLKTLETPEKKSLCFPA